MPDPSEITDAADEFIVIDTECGGYVESIEPYYGDVENCSDPTRARIFRGQAWRDFWAPPRYLHSMVPREIERCPKDIES